MVKLCQKVVCMRESDTIDPYKCACEIGNDVNYAGFIGRYTVLTGQLNGGLQLGIEQS